MTGYEKSNEYHLSNQIYTIQGGSRAGKSCTYPDVVCEGIAQLKQVISSAATSKSMTVSEREETLSDAQDAIQSDMIFLKPADQQAVQADIGLAVSGARALIEADLVEVGCVR